MFGGSFSNRLIDGLTMFIVTAASLMLLLYVGYGDSKRTYEQIHIEKITTNGQLVQNSIEKFLRDGLPLRQYAGFRPGIRFSRPSTRRIPSCRSRPAPFQG
jgi:hypothetical protein